MRLAILGAIAFGVLPVLAQPQPQPRDWHIGCASSGECTYYEDAKHDHAGLDRRQVQVDWSDSDSEIHDLWPLAWPWDWDRDNDVIGARQDDTDLEVFDTRCSSSDGFEIVRMVNGNWEHHFTCPREDPCFDLGGHGGCQWDKEILYVPGKSHIWSYTCKNPRDFSTCTPLRNVPIEQWRAVHETSKQETHLITRCNPGEKVIQFFNGTDWTNFFSCPPGDICMDASGRGTCRNGLSLLVPMHNEARHAKRDYSAPTRCNPVTMGHVQYYSAANGQWIDFHTCEWANTCTNRDGRGICDDGEGLAVGPVALLPGDGSNPEPEPESELPPLNKKIAVEIQFDPIEIQLNPDASEPKTKPVLKLKLEPEPFLEPSPDCSVETEVRCDPDDETRKFVQYRRGNSGPWTTLYRCSGICIWLNGYSACREDEGKYLVPEPPKPQTCPLTSRGIPVPTSQDTFSSRCNPQDPRDFQVFQNETQVAYGECPYKSPCNDVDGWAECDVHGQQWFPQRPGNLLSRENPPAPDFHTFDSRCNPKNSSDVQRFNGTDWIHHYTCTFKGSCVDVDGHGACYLNDGVVLLPSVNDSTINIGEPVIPLRTKTKCNKLNDTEVLQWNGSVWGFDGVCLSPYVCYDFNGASDFAVCAHKDMPKSQIWMPWPSFTAPAMNGLMTRCANDQDLYQFNGKEWTLYRRCVSPFTCSEVGGAPFNGGCVAHKKNVRKEHALRPRRIPSAAEDTEHYDPFGFNHHPKLPKRAENALTEDIEGFMQRDERGLVDDSIEMRHQGQNLVKEGNQLEEQGRKLLRAIFGGDGTNDAIANKSATTAAATRESLSSAPLPTNTVTGYVSCDSDSSDDSDDLIKRDDCTSLCNCRPHDVSCRVACKVCEEIHDRGFGDSSDDFQDLIKRDACTSLCNCRPHDLSCKVACKICKEIRDLSDSESSSDDEVKTGGTDTPPGGVPLWTPTGPARPPRQYGAWVDHAKRNCGLICGHGPSNQANQKQCFSCVIDEMNKRATGGLFPCNSECRCLHHGRKPDCLASCFICRSQACNFDIGGFDIGSISPPDVLPYGPNRFSHPHPRPTKPPH